MNKVLLAAALAAGAVPAIAAAQVGVSVSIGQPGFFGEINIGDVQQQPPQVIYAQPVVAQPPPAVVVGPPPPPPPPMYLHVPPGYERHWGRYCVQYQACGRPVYFVKDDWYNRVYVPHYHQMHPEGMMRHEEAVRHEEIRHEEAVHHEHAEERAYDHEHDH